MKFEWTPEFAADLKKLKAEHLRQFRQVLANKFLVACDDYAEDPTRYSWPAGLRVKAMKSALGIYEMIWSFASPDGHATFEFITINGEIYCRWRRIGDHDVFQNP